MTATRSTGVEIRHVEGEDYEGHPWGYMVLLNGVPYLHVTTGGTGPCWNLALYEDWNGGWAVQREGDWHVCELDELITVLRVLRDSSPYRLNVERWS